MARRENQGREQGVLDQSRARQTADYELAKTRQADDYSLARSRVTDDATRGLTEVDRQWGYGDVDRREGLERAGSENKVFQEDLVKAREWQAAQNGYVAPKPPSNEFRDKAGNPYQVRLEGGGKYRAKYDQFGKRLSRVRRGA
jgi:YD repeat-containing protein